MKNGCRPCYKQSKVQISHDSHYYGVSGIQYLPYIITNMSEEDAVDAFRGQIKSAGLHGLNERRAISDSNMAEIIQPPEADGDVEMVDDLAAAALKQLRRKSRKSHDYSNELKQADEMKDELYRLRSENERLVNKLEDYEDLCRYILPKEKVSVHSLAKYIGDLQVEEDSLVELKRERAKLQEKLVGTEAELAKLKKEHTKLLAAGDEIGGAGSTNSVDRSLLEELERRCGAKDRQIKDLQQKLEIANEAAGTTLNKIVESSNKVDETEIIAMAERELKLMEELIAEQEKYIRDMEKEWDGHEDISQSIQTKETAQVAIGK